MQVLWVYLAFSLKYNFLYWTYSGLQDRKGIQEIGDSVTAVYCDKYIPAFDSKQSWDFHSWEEILVSL